MHLFLDLEALTLINPDGALTELGAILFYDNGLTASPFHKKIVVGPGNELAEVETLQWHKKQGTFDLDRLAEHNAPASSLQSGLRAFIQTYGDDLNSGKIKTVWSWGSTYDFPRMEHLLRKVGLSVPWKYSQIRDARGVWKMAFGEEKPKPRTHCAFQDTLDSVADLVRAGQHLGLTFR